MNPWGLLEGEGVGPEQGRVSGSGLAAADVRRLVSNLNSLRVPAGSVRLEGYAFDGGLFVLGQDGAGRTQRLDPLLQPAPLEPADWDALTMRLLPGVPVRSSGWLETDDSYYYDHHEKLDFPVYRIVFDNPERRRYYLDAHSGRIVQKVDVDRRWYRWLFHAVHRGDFSAVARSRPLWDLFMLLLLSGVTVTCVTGAWMGLKRLKRM